MFAPFLTPRYLFEIFSLCELLANGCGWDEMFCFVVKKKKKNQLFYIYFSSVLHVCGDFFFFFF